MTNYSVLLPVYIKDNPSWLKTAIESMLAQTLPPEEIVIAVDGPVTEELDAVIKEYEANKELFSIYRFDENEGLGLLLKKTVPLCRNDVIARMDADDYSLPERCKTQISYLASDTIGLVGCNVNEYADTPGNTVSVRTVPEHHIEIREYAKRRNPMNHPSVMYKKQEVLSAGNYTGEYPLIEDFDLWVRMLKNGTKAYNVQTPLYEMRFDNAASKRRGGIKYLKTQLRFNKMLRKTGWSTLIDYLIRSAALTVTCLVGQRLRGFIYRKALRRRRV